MKNQRDSPREIVIETEPVWARPETFPRKPDGGRLGYISKGPELNEVGSREELIQAVSGEKGRVAILVWTEESDYCVPPEEVTWLQSAVLGANQRHAESEYKSASSTSLLIGAFAAFALLSAWRATGSLLAAFQDQNVVVAGLILTMFGLLPLYNAWKSKRQFSGMAAGDISTVVPEARFDIWIGSQRAPATRAAVALMVIAGVAQVLAWFRGGDVMSTVQAAGLFKQQVLAGEWWRYMTAPFLHGNPVHWFFNASALWYLGRRTEVLARWPHVPIILLISGFAGGLLSVAMVSFYPQPSVGASGAIVGLLGFLLVFETTHKPLVPRSSRRRLLAVVGGLVVIGIVGVQLIDNAAHAGGLLAGMVYSWIVFPGSKSPERPLATRSDLIAAGVCGAVILIAFFFTLIRLRSVT